MSDTREVLVEVFSVLSLVVTFIILTPQAWHHYRHQSTEGLSTVMMRLFLIGSIVPAVYDIHTSQPIAITLSWYGFATINIFILCQIPYYSAISHKAQLVQGRQRRFVLQFVLYALACVGVTLSLYFLFKVSAINGADWLPTAVGYILPIVLTVLGYLLQIRLIIAEKNSSGISPMFILLDLLGCTASILAVAFNDWDGAAVAPFFTIISCQFVMAALYYVIYPDHGTKQCDEYAVQPVGMKGIDIDGVDDIDIDSDMEIDSNSDDEDGETTDPRQHFAAAQSSSEIETSHTSDIIDDD